MDQISWEQRYDYQLMSVEELWDTHIGLNFVCPRQRIVEVHLRYIETCLGHSYLFLMRGFLRITTLIRLVGAKEVNKYISSCVREELVV